MNSQSNKLMTLNILSIFCSYLLVTTSLAAPTISNLQNQPSGYVAMRSSTKKSDRLLGFGMRIEELLDPDNYHKYIRPGVNLDPPLVVQTNLEISSIDDVSDVNMEYVITFTLYQSWRDDRLDKMRKVKNLKPIIVDASVINRVWVPDTYIVNAHNSFIHDVTSRNGLLILYPNGTVTYVLRITSRIACPMKLFKYPMDTQTCKLILASWSFAKDDLLYAWNGRKTCGGKFGSVTGMERVVLTQFNVTRCIVYNSSHERLLGNYSELVMEFVLKRNIFFFILQTYVPSSLLVAMSWVSFWIDVKAVPARVALCITTVLSMTTLMIGVYSSGPKSTSSIKALDFYVMVCYGFIFATMLEYACMHYYLRRSTANSLSNSKRNSFKIEELPHATNYRNNNFNNKITTVNQNDQQWSFNKIPVQDNKDVELASSHDSSEEAAMRLILKWERGFGYLAPVLFGTFNICYWNIYSTMSD